MSKDAKYSILLWVGAIVVVVVVAFDLLPAFEFPSWFGVLAFGVMAIDVITGLVSRLRKRREDQ
jgi:uncharacterized membrane protein